MVCVKPPNTRCRFHKGKPRATHERVEGWIDGALDRDIPSHDTRNRPHMFKTHKKNLRQSVGQNRFLDSLTQSQGRMKDGRRVRRTRGELKDYAGATINYIIKARNLNARKKAALRKKRRR